MTDRSFQKIFIESRFKNKVNLSQFINTIFSRGNVRTFKAKINILFSIFLQVGSMLLSIFLLPITLRYIDPTRYGIWLTVTSVVNWMHFLNLGLGNGLRNKFAEAIAKNDTESAKSYISTTYYILSFISLGLLLLFLIINPLIDWSIVFNANKIFTDELNALLIIVVTSFCFQLVLQLIISITTADQLPAIQKLTIFISKLITFLTIYLLLKTTTPSLIAFGLTFSYAPILTLFITTIIFFSKKYRDYSPNYKKANFSDAKILLSLGIKFFILQFTWIILYATDNMIITHIFGPDQVAPYNISYKYFGFSFNFFTIIISPIWSAVTDAYYKNENKWIDNSLRKISFFWLIYILFLIFLLLIASSVFKIWLPQDDPSKLINIPFKLNLAMAFFFIFHSWNAIISAFLNGMNKVKLQIIWAVISAVSNIPLSIIFAKTLNFGVSGVIFATAITSFLASILGTVQLYKIINKTAKHIWNE